MFPEDGFGSGDWEGQLKRYFSCNMRQLGLGLLLCLGTKEECSKIGN